MVVIGTPARREGQGVDAMRAPISGMRDERQAAFARMLESSLDRAYRLARVMLADPNDADDALADASLRAWRSQRSLRDPTRFEAWFTRIVANVCRDRRASRRSEPMPLAFDLVGVTDAYDEAVERDALRDALRHLTPDHRAVIALHYLEGLTVREIADALGVRAGTVKSRLHYGVAELRAAYDAAARDGEPARATR
jgi:RNA polymerase sigma-70 factor (ECF subfamily)